MSLEVYLHSEYLSQTSFYIVNTQRSHDHKIAFSCIHDSFEFRIKNQNKLNLQVQCNMVNSSLQKTRRKKNKILSITLFS